MISHIFWWLYVSLLMMVSVCSLLSAKRRSVSSSNSDMQDGYTTLENSNPNIRMSGTTINLARASHFVMCFTSQCVMCSVGSSSCFTAYNMYHFTVYNVYHWTIMHVLLLINVYRRPKRDSRLLCFGIRTIFCRILRRWHTFVGKLSFLMCIQ